MSSRNSRILEKTQVIFLEMLSKKNFVLKKAVQNTLFCGQSFFLDKMVLSEVGLRPVSDVSRPVGDLSISGGVCIESLCQRPVNIDPSRSTIKATNFLCQNIFFSVAFFALSTSLPLPPPPAAPPFFSS